MTYIGIGLAKNTNLEKLSLSDNDIHTKESISYIVRGLLENYDGS